MVAFRLVGDSEIELLPAPSFHRLTLPLVPLLAPCELRAKICFNFCPAAVTCPISGCRLPENILQIQSCTPFDEEPDYFTMAAPSGLVQRCRVGMAADRVVSIWILTRVKQQSNHFDLTKLRCQGECQSGGSRTPDAQSKHLPFRRHAGGCSGCRS